MIINTCKTLPFDFTAQFLSNYTLQCFLAYTFSVIQLMIQFVEKLIRIREYVWNIKFIRIIIFIIIKTCSA